MDQRPVLFLPEAGTPGGMADNSRWGNTHEDQWYWPLHWPAPSAHLQLCPTVGLLSSMPRSAGSPYSESNDGSAAMTAAYRRLHSAPFPDLLLCGVELHPTQPLHLAIGAMNRHTWTT